MVQISTDDVRHLASLSALALTDQEVETLRGDIADILSYINQLSELNTDGVIPSYQVTGLTNVGREDVVGHDNVAGPELVERLAPAHESGQFKVPKVL